MNMHDRRIMAADSNDILIVEDESSIASLISFTLQETGWKALSASSVAEAWERLQRSSFQLVLLDWMMPDQSGLCLLSRIRADRNLQHLPVIMLTARGMEEDKVAGLDTGADDYITKPFSPSELVSRVRALLRRRSPEHAHEVLTAGPVSLDPVNFSVTLNGQPIDMGHSEFRLLKFLLAHPERVFSRSQLLDRVWGEHTIIEERTVDVHVLRLRKALGEGGVLIRTVRSVGYKLSSAHSLP